MKKVLLFLLSICAVLFFARCKKDDTIFGYNNAPVLTKTNLHGLITDEANQPILGATVTTFVDMSLTADNTTYTDENGVFSLSNVWVTNGVVRITVEKAGYLTKVYNGQWQGEQSVFRIKMFQPQQAYIGGSIGGNIAIGTQASVTLPANSYVNAAGAPHTEAILVKTFYANPESPDFHHQMQGSNFVGTDASGTDQLLHSYGAISVELSDLSNNPLQLAPGSTATIRMNIPPSLQNNPPTTIPLWYFDNNKGKWVEEGSAQLVGNEYVGQVSHFTWWNCDVPIDPNTHISGTVYDCNNNPMPNIPISIGPLLVFSDQNGNYRTAIASGIDFNVWIDYITGSDSIFVPPVSPGDDITLDLHVNCGSYIIGTANDCVGNPVTNLFGIVSWGGEYWPTAFSNNNFIFIVPVNMPIDIMLYNGAEYKSYSTSVTSLGTGDTLGIGDIMICDISCNIVTQSLSEYPPFIIGDWQFIGGLSLWPTENDMILLDNGYFGFQYASQYNVIFIGLPDTLVGTYDVSTYTAEAIFGSKLTVAFSNMSSGATGCFGSATASAPVPTLQTGHINLEVFDANIIAGSFSGEAAYVSPPFQPGPPYFPWEGTFCFER